MKLPRSEFQPIGASRKQGIIAVLTLAAIALHLLLRTGVHTIDRQRWEGGHATNDGTGSPEPFSYVDARMRCR